MLPKLISGCGEILRLTNYDKLSLIGLSVEIEYKEVRVLDFSHVSVQVHSTSIDSPELTDRQELGVQMYNA